MQEILRSDGGGKRNQPKRNDQISWLRATEIEILVISLDRILKIGLRHLKIVEPENCEREYS